MTTRAFWNGRPYMGSLWRHVAAFLRDRSGVAAIYMGVTGALLVGGGVLAIDVGRIMVLRGEMQNMADSAALSAAIYLDGSSGAIARADAVAKNAILLGSGLASDSTTLSVATTTFYSAYVKGGTQTTTTVDSFAGFVKVDLTPRDIDILLKPVYELVAGSNTDDTMTLNTFAVAEYRPLSCETAPMMVCAPTDPADAEWPVSALNPDNIGKQFVMKGSPGNPDPNAPGNFGPLEATAGSGAKTFADEFSSPGSNQCTGDGVKTAPGSMTNKVVQAINARFEDTFGGGPDSAPATSIKEYPDDATPAATLGFPGAGDWPAYQYWNDNHVYIDTSDAGGATSNIDDIPIDLQTALGMGAAVTNAVTAGTGARLPTRYQTYLYEIGASFKVEDAHRAHVAYPPNAAASGTWTDITPTDDGNPPIAPAAAVDYVYGGGLPYNTPDFVDAYVPADGQPTTPGDFTPYCVDVTDIECMIRHRTVLVVALDCRALSISGKATITGVKNFVRFFITEKSTKPPGDADIVGELIGPETAAGLGGAVKNAAIIGSVKLVD